MIKFRKTKCATLLYSLSIKSYARNNPNFGFHVQRIHRTVHLSVNVQIFMKSVCQRSPFFVFGCKITALLSKDAGQVSFGDYFLCLNELILKVYPIELGVQRGWAGRVDSGLQKVGYQRPEGHTPSAVHLFLHPGQCLRVDCHRVGTLRF